MSEFTDLFQAQAGVEQDQGVESTPDVAPSPEPVSLSALLTSPSVPTETFVPTLELETQDIVEVDDVGNVKPGVGDPSLPSIFDLLPLGFGVAAGGAKPGFGASIAKGIVRARNSAIGIPAAALASAAKGFVNSVAPNSAFAEWVTASEAAEQAKLQFRQELGEELPTTGFAERLGKAEDFNQFWTTFRDDPDKWTGASEILGESLASSAGVAAGYVVGGLPGVFGSAFTLTWGDEYQESLNEGKEPGKAARDATTKALIQAGVDTTTMRIASIELASNSVVDWMAQIGVQMTAGGGAELLKAGATGEEVTFGEVGLEALGELLGGSLEIGAVRSKNRSEVLTDPEPGMEKTELTAPLAKDIRTLSGLNSEAEVVPLHQLTQEEFDRQLPDYDVEDFGVEDLSEVTHKKVVQQALLRGDPVPLTTVEAYSDIVEEQRLEAETKVKTTSEFVKETEDRSHALFDIDEQATEDLTGSKDRWSTLMDQTAGLWWIAKKNPHIAGLGRPTSQGTPSFVQSLGNIKASAGRILNKANTRAQEIRKLGIDQERRMSEYLLEKVELSDTKGLKLLPADLQELADKHGLTQDTIAVTQSIDRDFDEALNQLEALRTREIGNVAQGNPEGAAEMMREMVSDFSALRSKEFFPYSRFGKHGVIVKDTSNNKTQHFETFQTKSEADSRLAQLRKRFAKQEGIAVAPRIVDQDLAEYMSMPLPLLKRLRSDLELSTEQNAALDETIARASPARGFAKKLKRREGITGFSRDSLLAYASYMRSFASHISKLENSADLDAAILEVDSSVSRITLASGDPRSRQAIAKSMKELKDYLMNPKSEWDAFRSISAIWYLGAVPKSAVINLTQMPMVTLPYLSSIYGDAKAAKFLINGINESYGTYANTTNTERWNEPNTNVDSEMSAAISRATNEQVLDQSFASELAGITENRNLDRAMDGKLRNIHQDVAHAAMYMFQMSEKFIRRSTFIASYRLAKDAGKTEQGAYNSAVDAVNSTLFDYTKDNRAKLLRGKKGAFFVFWNFLLNMMNFLGNNQGTGRALLMLMAAGGLQALPFKENIDDLINFAIKQMNKRFGINLGVEDIRTAQREWVQETLDDPEGVMTDVIMHGASRYSYGLASLGNMMGLPIPNVDLSGSVSLGRIVPGTEALNARDFKTGFMQLGTSVAGAGFNIPLGVSQALWDDNPDTSMRVQKALPQVAKNILNAYIASGGRVTDRTHTPIMEFDVDDPRQQAEIIAMAGGFAPTRLKQERQKRYLQREVAQFYATRKAILLTQFDWVSQVKENREGRADVIKAIKKYNRQVPHNALKITSKMLDNSRKNRALARLKSERGFAPSAKNQGLYRDVSGLFPDPDKAQGLISEEETK